MAEVLHGIPVDPEISPGVAQIEVTGLDYDSRRILPGFLFFAFPGSRADGRAFAEAAIERGAVAVISETPNPEGFSRNMAASSPWPSGARNSRAQLLWAECIADRHHRNQRQNHHGLSDRLRITSGGEDDRFNRNDRVSFGN